MLLYLESCWGYFPGEYRYIYLLNTWPGVVRLSFPQPNASFLRIVYCSHDDQILFFFFLFSTQVLRTPSLHHPSLAESTFENWERRCMRAHLPSSHIASTWPSVAASLNQAAAAPKSRLPPGICQTPDSEKEAGSISFVQRTRVLLVSLVPLHTVGVGVGLWLFRHWSGCI